MTASPPLHRIIKRVVRRVRDYIRLAAVIGLITLCVSLLTVFIERDFDPLSGVSYRGFPSSVVVVNPQGSDGPRFWIPPAAFGINFVLWLGPVTVIWIAIEEREYQKKSRRRREGRCVNCGYDLTGNTSGICPECGWSAESKY